MGAKPIAITNCLNFGNPEDKIVMGEFANCVKGIKQACEYLNFPVVSGNVSFYNGTNKKNINPTPVVGGVGLIRNTRLPINHRLKKEDSLIILIGKTFGHLDQSALYEEVFEIKDGPPPEINFFNEKVNGETVLEIISRNLVNSVHDVSSGGLIISLAEMSLSSGIGINIEKPKKLNNIFEYFFGEDQGRYVLEINKSKYNDVKNILIKNNVHFELVGKTQKSVFEIKNEIKINVNELSKLNKEWYYKYYAN